MLAACRMFVDEARAFGAVCICTTCTSAARDASNAALLLDGLRDLGLEPQVIPGEVEARLTFFGVAHDFAGERIIVADSGGGSHELATASMHRSAASLRWKGRVRWTLASPCDRAVFLDTAANGQ